MNQFPLMLYRWPGITPAAVALQDGNYDTQTVDDADAHEAALADGWHESMADAKAAGEAAQAEANRNISGGEPPTRDELEQKATELGLNFSARVSDRKLAEAIAAKLAE